MEFYQRLISLRITIFILKDAMDVSNRFLLDKASMNFCYTEGTKAKYLSEV